MTMPNNIYKKQHCSVDFDYDDRFCWHEGEITFSKNKYVPTDEEIAHANEVIDKVKEKFLRLLQEKPLH